VTAPVTVTPETFSLVEYDAELIRRVATTLADSLGLDRPVRIEVDESTPLARISVEVGDEIVVRADSGALEDTRNPRHQSETATATSLGRVLLRSADRLHGGFGEAPADNELTLTELAAWETYCLGRLARLGVEVNQQRWRYNFRNRHGFSDDADAAFDEIWASDGLTWAQLKAISERALSSRQPASSVGA
jgi:hypothetical protein